MVADSVDNTRRKSLLVAALLFMLSTLMSACTGAVLQALNVPSYLLGTLRVEQDVSYGQQPHQKLDMYYPTDELPRKNTLVVFTYGGGWTSGKKEDYYFVADAFTSAGYTVAIPDYIKYPEGEFPHFVDDIALSIAWLAKQIQSDNTMDQMALIGHSAGAHTSALLITDSRYLETHSVDPGLIQAFVGLAGPYGFIPKEKRYKDIFSNLNNFEKMQPLHFVTGSEPAMLLLHGSRDTTVLPINTERFAEKVNRSGGSASTQIYDGQSHIAPVLALSRLFDRDNTVRNDILEFLRKIPSPSVGE